MSFNDYNNLWILLANFDCAFGVYGDFFYLLLARKLIALVSPHLRIHLHASFLNCGTTIFGNGSNFYEHEYLSCLHKTISHISFTVIICSLAIILAFTCDVDICKMCVSVSKQSHKEIHHLCGTHFMNVA